MGACMVIWSAVKGLDLTLKPPWRKRQSDVVTSGWLVGSPGLLGRCPEDCGRIGLGGNAEQRQKGAVPSPDARPRGAAVGSGEEQNRLVLGAVAGALTGPRHSLLPRLHFLSLLARPWVSVPLPAHWTQLHTEHFPRRHLANLPLLE